MSKSALTLYLAFACIITSPFAKAACELEQHTQFDFWLGIWRVTLADGTHAGDNTIEKIQNGCALRESWASARSGFTGTSVNFFNQSSGMWEQIWVDNQGSSLHLNGGRSENQMILSSEPAMDDAGNQVVNQITWTRNDDGTVRQEWLSKTQGQDDKVLFDGIYTLVDE